MSQKPSDQPPASDPQHASLADMTVKDPDDLLKSNGQGLLAKGIIISLVVHVLILGLTSFSLYGDWQEHGFMMPSQIKQKKKEQKIAAARAEVERKAEEARKAAAAEAAKQAGNTDPGGTTPKGPGGTGNAKTPLDNETEKPKDSFDLKDIDLDI